MKRLTTCFYPNPIAILALATLCLLVIRAGAQSSETYWTNVEGVTIWARLTGLQGANVLFVMRGQEYRVPMERLTPESVAKARHLLDLLETKPANARPTFADAGPALPAQPSINAVPTVRRDKHSMPFYSFRDCTRIVRTTAYSSGESDHLIYGSKNAIGTPLQYSDRLRSAAADWSVYPVGTTFTIKGLPHIYVVDDYGSALAGTGTIDLYHPTLEDMRRWGRRNVEITVTHWGSLSRSAQILSQRQGASHCREMLASILRQRPQLGALAACR